MGKILASYLIRVTLRERDDHAETDWGKRDEPAPDGPTNGEIEAMVGQVLYDQLDYFTDREIRVTSERLDK